MGNSPTTTDQGTGTAAAEKEVSDYWWGKRDEALYRAQLSSLYHQRRERFFDALDRVAMAAVLFSGSAAFAVAANEAMVKWAGAAAALAGATSLVMGFSEKARRHAALAERFKQIEADIHEVGEYDYTPEQVAAWQARIVRLEAHEPPTRHILARMCQNDMAFAVGQPDKMTHIPVVQRLLAHFVSFSAQNAQIKPS